MTIKRHQKQSLEPGARSSTPLRGPRSDRWLADLTTVCDRPTSNCRPTTGWFVKDDVTNSRQRHKVYDLTMWDPRPAGRWYRQASASGSALVKDGPDWASSLQKIPLHQYPKVVLEMNLKMATKAVCTDGRMDGQVAYQHQFNWGSRIG